VSDTEHRVRALMTTDENLDDVKRARLWARLEPRLLGAHAPARSRWRWALPTGGALAAAAAIAVWLGRGGDAPRALVAPADATLTAMVGPYARVAVVGPARVEVGAEGETSAIRVRSGTLLAEFEGGAGRSLRVVAPGLEVEVVGTLFAVAVDGTGTCVSVAHGRVRVTTAAGVVMVGGDERMCTGDARSRAIEPSTRDALLRHEQLIAAADHDRPHHNAPSVQPIDPPPAIESSATPPRDVPSVSTASAATTPAPPAAITPAVAITTTAPAITHAPSSANTQTPAAVMHAPSPDPITHAPMTRAPSPAQPAATHSAPDAIAHAPSPDPITHAPITHAPSPAQPPAARAPSPPAITQDPDATHVPSPSPAIAHAPAPEPPAVAHVPAVTTHAPSPVVIAQPPATHAPSPAQPAVTQGSPVATHPSPPAPRPAEVPTPAAPITADSLYRDAETALTKGNLAGADRALAKIIDEFSSSSLFDQALYERARLAYQRHAWSQARRDLDRLAGVHGSALAEPGQYLGCRVALAAHDADVARCFVAYRTAYPRSPHALDVLALLVELAHADGGCRAAEPLIGELVRDHREAAQTRAWRTRCPEPR